MSSLVILKLGYKFFATPLLSELVEIVTASTKGV